MADGSVIGAPRFLFLLVVACGAPSHSDAAGTGAAARRAAPGDGDDYYLGVLRLGPDAGAVPTIPVYSTRITPVELAPLLDSMSRALGYDYVALGMEGSRVEEGGWRCAHAPDREQCAAAFDAILPPREVWQERGAEHALMPRRCFLLVERAGVFELASTPDTVKRALGGVDSLAKAGLFAWLDGYDPWSPGPETIVPTGQADGVDWRLTARTRHLHDGKPMACAWNMHDLFVSRAGAVRVVRTVPVLKGHVCGSDDQLP